MGMVTWHRDVCMALVLIVSYLLQVLSSHVRSNRVIPGFCPGFCPGLGWCCYSLIDLYKSKTKSTEKQRYMIESKEAELEGELVDHKFFCSIIS